MDHAAVQFTFSLTQYINWVSAMGGLRKMPWENTEQHIRSGHRDPEEFRKNAVKLGWELWENVQPKEAEQ
jgi:hypothetical protein